MIGGVGKWFSLEGKQQYKIVVAAYHKGKRKEQDYSFFFLVKWNKIIVSIATTLHE
jgi:hypothetical protein